MGHYNYYVMSKELYEELKDEIPKHIGVYANGYYCIKRPKKQKLKTTNDILFKSMIRSLYRDYEKGIENKDIDLINKVKNLESKFKNQNSKMKTELWESERELKYLYRQIRKCKSIEELRESIESK